MKNQKDDTSHKGFTLVELIVVIVILAILAAVLIPGLLKWINHAKKKQYEREARNIYLATEASLVELHAWGFADTGSDNVPKGTPWDLNNLSGVFTVSNNNTAWFAYIKEMSGIDNIAWMRIYTEDGRIKAINVDYVSPSDGTPVKAYRKEIGYTNNEDGDFNIWFGDGKANDGLWHFYDREKKRPIS